jgi:hypothetical protein
MDPGVTTNSDPPIFHDGTGGLSLTIPATKGWILQIRGITSSGFTFDGTTTSFEKSGDCDVLYSEGDGQNEIASKVIEIQLDADPNTDRTVDIFFAYGSGYGPLTWIELTTTVARDPTATLPTTAPPVEPNTPPASTPPGGSNSDGNDSNSDGGTNTDANTGVGCDSTLASECGDYCVGCATACAPGGVLDVTSATCKNALAPKGSWGCSGDGCGCTTQFLKCAPYLACSSDTPITADQASAVTAALAKSGASAEVAAKILEFIAQTPGASDLLDAAGDDISSFFANKDVVSAISNAGADASTLKALSEAAEAGDSGSARLAAGIVAAAAIAVCTTVFFL